MQMHGHAAFSVLAIEAILHARTMGFPVVFTDHSLFGFADAASICTNKVLKWTLSDVQAVICVSHTARENTVLRACLSPSTVFVVPNAVDVAKFQPFPRPKSPAGAVTYAFHLVNKILSPPDLASAAS
jgi:phosphatidylinositol glycan class A protein